MSSEARERAKGWLLVGWFTFSCGGSGGAINIRLSSRHS